jgi:hypothetical protein
MHHSLQLPDNNFKTRLYDGRSPYITNSYFDYSTPITEPIQKNYIRRHRLQKKDPSAAKSEAIKPIIYYLDNGTNQYEVLYWKVQVGGIKRLNQQVLLMLSGQNFT